jgi:hypothetical protein
MPASELSPFSSESPLRDLINMACGRFESDASRQRILQLSIGSVLCALLLSAAWGAAAGSSSFALAAASSIKVPLVVLLSTLSALPATLLALKLSGVNYSGVRLLASISSGVFGGTLALASLAPIVGIYYHTSAVIGAQLAVASAFIAIGVGGMVMLRNALRDLPKGLTRRHISVPLAIFVVVLLAAMVQFIALAAPILPDASAFDGGIDGLLLR